MNLNFNKEKKIGLIILGAAVAVAGFLVFYDADSFKKSLAEVKKEKEAAMQAEEFSLEKESKDLGVTGGVLDDLFKNSNEDNLTDKITADISQKILSLNQSDDLEEGKIMVPDESLLTAEIISNHKNDFFQSEESVSVKDFLTINDDLPKTTLEYFQNLLIIIRDNNITEEHLDDLLSEFLETENVEYLKQPIRGMDNAILELKKMKVPNSWLSLHVGFTNFLITKKIFYQSFYNQKNDPLKAAIASQLIDDLNNNLNRWYEAVGEKLEKDGAFIF